MRNLRESKLNIQNDNHISEFDDLIRFIMWDLQILSLVTKLGISLGSAGNSPEKKQKIEKRGFQLFAKLLIGDFLLKLDCVY
jgi:hypothetical protein